MLKRVEEEMEWDRFPLTGRFLMGRLRHAMTADEKKLLESMVMEVRTLADAEVLVRRGVETNLCSILIEGFMIRTVKTEDLRSIVSIQVPGDFVDLHAFALRRLDHDLVALGNCKVGVVEHAAIAEVLEHRPHLARLLWFSTLLDAAIHREWICKLEQLQAAARVAHIFSELWHRLDMAGLSSQGVVRTPLTQANLAEMCGITPIHMNRALAQLRREGIADFRRGTLYVEDRAKLEAFGAFNSFYLYGEAPLGAMVGAP
jgi:CRP-like cAMP-binding protein